MQCLTRSSDPECRHAGAQIRSASELPQLRRAKLYAAVPSEKRPPAPQRGLPRTRPEDSESQASPGFKFRCAAPGRASPGPVARYRDSASSPASPGPVPRRRDRWLFFVARPRGTRDGPLKLYLLGQAAFAILSAFKFVTAVISKLPETLRNSCEMRARPLVANFCEICETLRICVDLRN